LKVAIVELAPVLVFLLEASTEEPDGPHHEENDPRGTHRQKEVTMQLFSVKETGHTKRSQDENDAQDHLGKQNHVDIERVLQVIFFDGIQWWLDQVYSANVEAWCKSE